MSTSTSVPDGRNDDPVRGSSLLLVGRVVSIFVNTAYQVVLVRYLTQADYGVLAYGLAVAGFVQVAVSLGQERSVSRFVVFYDEDGRTDRVLGTLGLYVLSVLLMGSVALVVVMSLDEFVIRGLDDERAATVVAILVVVAALDSLDMMMQAVFAAFSRTRAIFFKKYLLNPMVKLAAVVAAVATNQSIVFITATLAIASFIGVCVYGAELPSLLRDRGILQHPLREHIQFPIGDVLRYSVPLLSSPFVFVAFMFGSVTVLASFLDSTAVADYRAIWPAARLNLVVSATFSVLFLPSLARLIRRGDTTRTNDAYWRTSAWVAVLTMPAFILTVPLAHHTTTLLFGERYASSAIVLALVSTGMYCDVTFGFNRQTLELFGKVWWVIATDAVTILLHLGLTVAVVPHWGPTGAAFSTMLALVARNVLNQALVVHFTPVTWLGSGYLPVYAGIVAGVVVCGVVDRTLELSAASAFLVAACCSLTTLRINRHRLAIGETFPELGRVPLVRSLLH